MWCLWSCFVKCPIFFKFNKWSSKTKVNWEKSITRNFRIIKKSQLIKVGKSQIIKTIRIKKERSGVWGIVNGGKVKTKLKSIINNWSN